MPGTLTKPSEAIILLDGQGKAMPNQPIDPSSGPRYALAGKGKIVTMDSHATILNQGIVYIDQGQIVAVQSAGAGAPASFDGALVIQTKGTIYPDLIELHNHLSYNILPLWVVPNPFENRAQWQGHRDKGSLITGPMQVLAKTPRYVPAIVRYVEAKSLLSGVTTSQGLALLTPRWKPAYSGAPHAAGRRPARGPGRCARPGLSPDSPKLARGEQRFDRAGGQTSDRTTGLSHITGRRGIAGNTLTATATTEHITQLDIFVGGRPQASLDVGDEDRRFTVELPATRLPGEPLFLELHGYVEGRLVATLREDMSK
jgi:hypothetical protein